MRVSLITIGLALAMSCGSLGCKSAPKMSWWKTADNSAATATTVATGAPQLPSEIAKQTEALASADPVKITTPAATAPAMKTAVATTTPGGSTTPAIGGTAPAYTSAASLPSSYPSTGAKSLVPAATTAASTAVKTAAAPAVNNLASASKALPYDPTAVPPAATTSAAALAAAIPSAPTQAERYGVTAQDRYAGTYPTTTTPAYSPTSYPTTNTTSAPTTAPVTNNVATTPATTSVPFASNPGSVSVDRYATQTTPMASQGSTALPSSNTPVQTASAVANVQPYRPGGTTSYPGTSANYEVATRPGTTSPTPSNYPAQYR